jgi:hypothetical protein
MYLVMPPLLSASIRKFVYVAPHVFASASKLFVETVQVQAEAPAKEVDCALQAVQDVPPPFPYVPAGHEVHPALVADGTQYVPAPQQTQPPVGVHWTYVPGGQLPPQVLHALDPAKEYVPAAHAVQAVAPGREKVLAGQGPTGEAERRIRTRPEPPAPE